MASVKRENPATEDQNPQSKRPKNTFDEPSHSQGSLRVVLNPADCNLDFNIEGDGLTGHALYEQGFAYCWSGARANIGIKGGKYCFGCKIVSGQHVEMQDTPFDQQNVCRVGISRGDDHVGSLGETEHSYGFGGTGKFSNAGRFVNYGERFGIGDTILCSVDLESKPWGSIEFSKNGKRLGIAKHFDAGPRGLGVLDSQAHKLPWESAMFPHVLLKNTVVVMQFSIEDGLVPAEGYKPWASAVSAGKAVVGPSFSDPRYCEVIMMVGLPASGKTTWAEKWVKEHPEKRYVLLGTNLALDQMKVPGLLRKNNYGERFDRLMDRATGIFNTLLSRAAKMPRNYIIDQTNVYKRARKRKLKPFAIYHKIAVVIFPTPEELKIRAQKRFKEMGKEVPPEAVNEMLANFILPMSKDMRNTDEYFDQVVFPELNRAEAQRHLDHMKHASAMALNGKSKSDHSPYSQGSSVHWNSVVSVHSTSNRDCSPHSWDYSVHSKSGASAYSVPGPGHSYSGYPAATPGSNWVGPPMTDMQPYPTNVNMGYRGAPPFSKAEPLGPHPNYTDAGAGGAACPGTVEPFSASFEGRLHPLPTGDDYHGTHSSYSNSFPRDGLTRYDGYMHDSGHAFGTPAGYMSNPGHARAAYRPPVGPRYGAPNPRPYGSFPANAQHPGSSPYGPPPPRHY